MPGNVLFGRKEMSSICKILPVKLCSFSSSGWTDTSLHPLLELPGSILSRGRRGKAGVQIIKDTQRSAVI